MSKIIWFEDKDGDFDSFFVVAEKITDATVMYEFKGLDAKEQSAELTIGLEGAGSRWRSVQFDSHDAADAALISIGRIILSYPQREYCISITDGTWRILEDNL